MWIYSITPSLSPLTLLESLGDLRAEEALSLLQAVLSAVVDNSSGMVMSVQSALNSALQDGFRQAVVNIYSYKR